MCFSMYSPMSIRICTHIHTETHVSIHISIHSSMQSHSESGLHVIGWVSPLWLSYAREMLWPVRTIILSSSKSRCTIVAICVSS